MDWEDLAKVSGHPHRVQTGVTSSLQVMADHPSNVAAGGDLPTKPFEPYDGNLDGAIKAAKAASAAPKKKRKKAKAAVGVSPKSCSNVSPKSCSNVPDDVVAEAWSLRRLWQRGGRACCMGEGCKQPIGKGVHRPNAAWLQALPSVSALKVFYVPPELLPNRHDDMNQLNGTYEQQIEQLDYEIDQIERMQEIEKRLKEENGSYAMTRSQAAEKDKDGIIWIDTAKDAAEKAKEVATAVGVRSWENAIEDEAHEMPLYIGIPVPVPVGIPVETESTLGHLDKSEVSVPVSVETLGHLDMSDKIKITDMCAAGLHKPKMKGCDICEQAYMHAEPARASKHDTADPDTDNDNMNADLIILNEPDNNGNIAAYHGFLTKCKVGYAAAITDKYSATTAKCGRTAKV